MEEILRYCNPKLPTHNWRVVKVEKTEGSYRQALVLLNAESLSPLAEAKGVINYGFEKVVLKVYQTDARGDAPAHPEVLGEARPTVEEAPVDMEVDSVTSEVDNADDVRSLPGMNILQINLQHSKAASANLLIRLEQGGADIVLIQEPWLSSNGISGLRTKSYKLVAYSRTGKPRSCILIRRELNAFILPNFSNEDIVTVSLEGPAGKLWLMSVYMAHDDEVERPPALLRETLAEAKRRKIGVIIGTDANSHHTCWGSSNINARDNSAHGKYNLNYAYIQE
ncbi:uncharacterized protein LOC128867256 [Anastrepha ludens]|uniref:uncharacterized protein LOC128867256 n=1 Tax=Anastrepha ludens TaxID=28586 RepID=UPI0023B05B6A|nr:uncharacterized protein LOC128867256 [Anastrepha ludens]